MRIIGMGLRLKLGKLYFTPFDDVAVYPNTRYTYDSCRWLRPYEPVMVTDAKYPVANSQETWIEYTFLVGVKTYHKLLFNRDLYKFVEFV